MPTLFVILLLSSNILVSKESNLFVYLLLRENVILFSAIHEDSADELEAGKQVIFKGKVGGGHNAGNIFRASLYCCSSGNIWFLCVIFRRICLK